MSARLITLERRAAAAMGMATSSLIGNAVDVGPAGGFDHIFLQSYPAAQSGTTQAPSVAGGLYTYIRKGPFASGFPSFSPTDLSTEGYCQLICVYPNGSILYTFDTVSAPVATGSGIWEFTVTNKTALYVGGAYTNITETGHTVFTTNQNKSTTGAIKSTTGYKLMSGILTASGLIEGHATCFSRSYDTYDSTKGQSFYTATTTVALVNGFFFVFYTTDNDESFRRYVSMSNSMPVYDSPPPGSSTCSFTRAIDAGAMTFSGSSFL